MTALAGALPASSVRFSVPDGSDAQRPPERRGLSRDDVRLLVVSPTSTVHRRFRDLPEHLGPGDLLVVNTSATVPAAVDATTSDGSVQPLHVSTSLDDGDWVVELRTAGNSGPDRGTLDGQELTLPGGVLLRLGAPYPDEVESAPRLRRATPVPPVTRVTYLQRHGRPIRYGYVDDAYPIEDYQTVYASVPGSAEMASAGRPLTERLLVELISRGVTVAPVVLHAGVSSPEAHEPPMAEWFEVPPDTARLVCSARRAGRRVVAVGTTVTRALESATSPHGCVHATSGWTHLVLGPDRPARVVNGLITGLHAPEASHLLLLEAVAGRALLSAAYEAAVEERYLWHEFGDSTLFLP
ncbi:MAG TPA: S-adenosylmethionine:tRNA ribosyltransferase-isomerase [Actinomycetales bacterium]|nr:S-adenosylmethionine:tRNA ribosyltransferase-isomerase [Actinomycetales bacterium]